MTAEERWLIDLSELMAIRLECTKCGAAVVVKTGDWRECPSVCPHCQNMWEPIRAQEESPQPINRFGLGLRLVMQQDQQAAKAGGVRPYRVLFEIKDPNLSKYR